MEAGRCPACARAYTSGEVVGTGILRPRGAERGGPLVEFACPGCGRRMTLVPHGHGRFAPPGVPPPPGRDAEASRPPWAEARTRPAGAPEAAEAETEAEGPPKRAGRATRPRPPPPGPVEADLPPARPAAAAPPTFAEALALLGVGPEADATVIDRAFRERSLLCHPDKVAHLDPDFQALADAKFRRLKAAHDLLSGRGRTERA